MSSDTDAFNVASLTEEVPKPILLSLEAQVTDEQSSSFGRSGASGPARLITTSRLLTELDPDLPSVQRALIRSGKRRLGLLVRLELDESLALVIKQLTLSEGTVRRIVGINAFIGRVERETLNKKLRLSSVGIIRTSIHGNVRGSTYLGRLLLLLVRR